MATTAVKAARHARGWTLRHTVTQLRTAAERIGERLPGEDSVRQRLMRFEAGARPGAFYRDLLCTIYTATPAELGLPDTRPTDPVREHAGRRISWDETPDLDAVTGLLYALPLDTAHIGRQSLTRIRLYLRLVTTDPHCPERHVLGAGLRRARAHQPPWLDRDRLSVCERLAAALTGQRPTNTAARVVPDWLTGSRLAAAASTAALFTTPTDRARNTDRPPHSS